LNIIPKFCGRSLCHLHLPVQFARGFWKIFLYFHQADRQQDEPLNDVVVKLPGEQGLLFFVRFD
jgi:hypothetical protein